MKRHYKIDLLNDAEMAAFDTKVGDVLSLSVPGEGTGEHKVVEIDVFDAGKHPESGEHLNRVSLTLEPLA
jgi:hypothetical protein